MDMNEDTNIFLFWFGKHRDRNALDILLSFPLIIVPSFKIQLAYFLWVLLPDFFFAIHLYNATLVAENFNDQ